MRCGKIAKTSHGRASPTPIINIMPYRTASDCDKAKLTAVPTKGAEQGVARSVASIPAPKSCIRWFWVTADVSWVRRGISFCTKAGVRNVTISNNDNVKIAVTMKSMPKNRGLWNWMPHPICWPNWRKICKKALSNKKDVIMPAALIANLALISFGDELAIVST